MVVDPFLPLEGPPSNDTIPKENEDDAVQIIFVTSESDELGGNPPIPSQEEENPPVPATQGVNSTIYSVPPPSSLVTSFDWNQLVAELLHEYQALFSTKIIDLKGIVGDLGIVKITLKSDAKPVKKQPYRLNPKYKEKVREELDKMLTAEIIEPMEESDSVSPMVVQEKKQKDEIRICMDLRKLNDACVHDPFLTLFTDEVLENFGD
eukprot:PITA_05155